MECRLLHVWTCIANAQHSISTPSALLLDGTRLLVAGWAAAGSDWMSSKQTQGFQIRRPYTIAITDLDDFFANASVPQTLTDPRNFNLAWSYLPKFVGVDGPILRMMAPVLEDYTNSSHNTGGSLHREMRGGGLQDDDSGALYRSGSPSRGVYIVGAFNDFPSVFYYDYKAGATVSVGANNNQISGLVTSIAMMRLRHRSPSSVNAAPNTPSVLIPVNPGSEHRHQWIFQTCVVLLSLMGFLFSISMYNHSSSISKDRSSPRHLHQLNSPAVLTLGMLGGGKSSQVDLEACFQRAMRARHMPAHTSLSFIDTDDIHLRSIIGQGSFGRVWSAVYRNNHVAVKEFVFAQAAVAGGSIEKHKLIEEIVGEAGVMTYLRHPKVLQLFGICMTAQAIWLVSELCTRGSLRMLLSDMSVDLDNVQKVRIVY